MKWFVCIASIFAFAFHIPAAEPLPEVSVYANQSVIGETTQPTSGSFSIVKSSLEPLTVHYEFIGTARLNFDYNASSTNQAETNMQFAIRMLNTFTNTANVSVYAPRDAEVEPDEDIVLRLLPDPSYEIGAASLAGIRIRSAPPPAVTLDLNPQTTTELATGIPFTFGGFVSANVTSIWVYIDDTLLTRTRPAAVVGGSYSVTWTNPTPGVHVISAEVRDISGMSARVSKSVRVVEAITKPAAIGGTEDGTSITSSTSTVYDRTGRSAVFVEFAIPANATNCNALLSLNYPVPAHQLFPYKGDGVVDDKDLLLNPELLGTFGGSDLQPQFEIGSLVRRYAGGHLGLKLQFDPTAPHVSAEGSQAGSFGALRILLFGPEANVPGTIHWTNFRADALHFNDEPLGIDLETVDVDSRVKAIEVIANSSTNPPRAVRLEVNLPPGRNRLSLLWTNDWPGLKSFVLRMEEEDESVTNYAGAITFYPTRANGPVHRWLGLDGEGTSFYVVDAAGRAWVWGRNQYGQLGLGFTNMSVTRPIALAAPAGRKWRHFTYNLRSAVGVTDDGEDYAMGLLDVIGEGGTAPRPQLITWQGGDPIQRAALTENGFWRVNGWSTLLQVYGPTPPDGTSTHTLTEVKDIDAGGTNILALRKDGVIEPLLRTNSGAALPWMIISRSKVHSLAIDSAGQMFGWGDNAFGQLPLGGRLYSDIPLKANPPPTGGRWTNVCAGVNVSLAVANGRLYSWGRDGWTGSSSYAPSEPRPVDMPEDEIGWLDMSAGSVTALALSARGNLYIWGRDEKPRKVEGLPPLLDANATASYVAFDSWSLRAQEGPTASLISGTPAMMTVQVSTNLVNWQTVTNFVNAVGRTSVRVPATEGGNVFMRVHSQ